MRLIPGLLARGWGLLGLKGWDWESLGGRGEGETGLRVLAQVIVRARSLSLLQGLMLCASLKPLLLQAEYSLCSYSPDKALRLGRAS